LACSECKSCLYGWKKGKNGCPVEKGSSDFHPNGSPRRSTKDKPIRLALVGNANVGKSAIFNQMTGLDQRTGNWAGKTVELARGKAIYKGRVFEIIDLPGTYSLSSFTEEEVVTREFLSGGEADVIINVVDATALERNLYLTSQVLELGIPMVLALNQTDLARKKGLKIDTRKLSRELGIPVLETVGITGQGLKGLMKLAHRLVNIKWFHRGYVNRKKRHGHRHKHRGFDHWIHYAHHLDERYVEFGPEVESRARFLQDSIKKPIRGYPGRFLACKLLEGDGVAATLIASVHQELLETGNRLRDELTEIHGEEAATVMTQERYSISNRIANSVTTISPGGRTTLSDKLDRVTTHPLLGYVIFITVIVSSFFLIFTVGDQVSAWFMSAFEWSGSYVKDNLGDGWLYLVVWEGAVQGFIAALAFVLPYILPFYILLALLEDSGYMARVAILMDAMMHRFGLHGKAFIPMILGYGCTVPAVLGTRILETRRERFIAAFMSGFIPCAARTTVIMALVGAFLGWYWALGLYVFNILLIALLGYLAAKLLPGKAYGLIMEIPRYHRPKAKVVLKQSWMRLRDFVVVAMPIIVIGSIVLVLFEMFNLTDSINIVLSPVTVWVLGLPVAVGVILLLGILRKELTIVMLVTLWNTEALNEYLTASQMIVFTLFVIFYIPCISTIAALVKEFGIRASVAISTIQFTVALIIGGLFNVLFMII